MDSPAKTPKEWTDAAIKFISEQTAEYKNPEVFSRWCAEFVEHTNGEYTCAPSHLYNMIRKRLETVETIGFLNTIQKIQLMFVLRQPINGDFYHETAIDNYVYIDEKMRIIRAESSDDSFIRSCSSPCKKFFKERPIVPKKYKRNLIGMEEKNIIRMEEEDKYEEIDEEEIQDSDGAGQGAPQLIGEGEQIEEMEIIEGNTQRIHQVDIQNNEQ